ncbi:MAG: SAM-dependent methyltransferase [Verrucomicrobia bacterium]|nr:SAM-dependent methyltransferase [Verrucomicrobiota bacterium]
MNAVDLFSRRLREAIANGTLRKLTLGKLREGLAGQEHVYVRPVQIRDALQLSFVHRYPDHDTVKNLPPEDGLAQVFAWLGTASLAVTLFTTDGRIQLVFNRRGKPRLAEERESAAPASLQHDRSKTRLVRDERFLHQLGVLDDAGQPKAHMGDKYRQVHHFITLVAPLTAAMRPGDCVRVADLGCGKGYLTFALYVLLTEAGLQVQMTGIEQRRPLVEFANVVARQCGYDGLRFQTGQIADTDISDTDLVVALHACDTATDDALLKAVRAGARWILVAPCCHKEVRPQMRPPPGLEPLFRFGIEADRLAESVTDTLRALCLEAVGYVSRIQEFISLEHTHKNVLIMATKQGKTGNRAQAGRQALAFQARFGIARQRLSEALAREHGWETVTTAAAQAPAEGHKTPEQ